MGQHAWLMSATVITELLIIFKFGRGQFDQPFPAPVKLFAGTGLVVLISYPIYKVSPALRVHLNIPVLTPRSTVWFPQAGWLRLYSQFANTSKTTLIGRKLAPVLLRGLSRTLLLPTIHSTSIGPGLFAHICKLPIDRTIPYHVVCGSCPSTRLADTHRSVCWRYVRAL